MVDSFYCLHSKIKTKLFQLPFKHQLIQSPTSQSHTKLSSLPSLPSFPQDNKDIKPNEQSSSHMYSWYNNNKKYIKQIPNALTILRVLLILPFTIAYTTQRNSLACGLFILASITDWLDGYLARKLRISSNFGAFLDPVADKLIVTTALILLVSAIPVWWFSVSVAVIICREVFVSALREWMAQRGLSATVKVGYMGKVKTATQMIAAVLLLDSGPIIVSNTAVKAFATTAVVAVTKGSIIVKGISSAMESTVVGGSSLSSLLHIPRPVLFALGLGMFFVSTVLTVLSGMEYLRAAWPLLSGSSGGTPHSSRGSSMTGANNSNNNSNIDENDSKVGNGNASTEVTIITDDDDVDPNKTPFDVP